MKGRLVTRIVKCPRCDLQVKGIARSSIEADVRVRANLVLHRAARRCSRRAETKRRRSGGAL